MMAGWLDECLACWMDGRTDGRWKDQDCNILVFSYHYLQLSSDLSTEYEFLEFLNRI